jgi:hypothetical protein
VNAFGSDATVIGVGMAASVTSAGARSAGMGAAERLPALAGAGMALNCIGGDGEAAAHRGSVTDNMVGGRHRTERDLTPVRHKQKKAPPAGGAVSRRWLANCDAPRAYGSPSRPCHANARCSALAVATNTLWVPYDTRFGSLSVPKRARSAVNRVPNFCTPNDPLRNADVRPARTDR